MFPDKVINKVPGQPSKNPKEKQGHIENISKLSIVEVTEILERQKKLLADRVFINRLPDKGKRILNFKEELENEVKKRKELLDVCEVMTGLNINGKNISDNLEWGNKTEGNVGDFDHPSDSEGEDSNPLKIIATHSGAGFHHKKVRKENPTKPLIKPSDLIHNHYGDSEEKEALTEPYAEILCTKFDSAKPNERYLPFKTLVHEKKISSDRVRENTAATPPVSKLENTKLVSLEESLRLQAEQVKHLREVQMKHAAERLREKGSIIMGDSLPPPESTSHYRESPPSDSEEEVVDDDAKEEPGGVIFPLANS